jgi:hypothetical protein
MLLFAVKARSRTQLSRALLRHHRHQLFPIVRACSAGARRRADRGPWPEQDEMATHSLNPPPPSTNLYSLGKKLFQPNASLSAE